MNGVVFEVIYRDKLWRISVSDFKGERRLSFWSHYRDSKTGEWKACGGKRDAPGCIVPADRVDELAAAVSSIAAQLRAKRS